MHGLACEEQAESWCRSTARGSPDLQQPGVMSEPSREQPVLGLVRFPGPRGKECDLGLGRTYMPGRTCRAL